MSFYHVSDKIYEINKIVDAIDFETTEYHQRIIQQGMGDIDNILDASRPKGTPSRKNCVYAFDNLDFCKHFVGNRYAGKEIYYEVELIDPIKCPIKLVKVINEGKYSVDREIIIKEYWEPRPENDWKYFEYLSTSMKIIDIVEGNNRMWRIIAGEKNDSDERLATKLFI